MVVNVLEAMEFFKRVPNATKWFPKTDAKNCSVFFERKGEGVIDKVIGHKNGLVQTGHFSGTHCTGVDEVSEIGVINTRFGKNGIMEVKTKATNGYSSSFVKATSKYKGWAIPPQFSRSGEPILFGKPLMRGEDIREMIRHPESLDAKKLRLDILEIE